MLHQPVKVFKLVPTAPRESQLQELSRLNRFLIEFSIANYKNRLIYLTGGMTNKLVRVDAVHVFDVIKFGWVTAPKMTKARWRHSSCSLGEYIYVFGGLDSNGAIESLEVKVGCNWVQICEQSPI